MQYREISSIPGKASQYFRAVTAKNRKNVTSIPRIGMVMRNHALDRDNISTYNQVCGFRDSGELPLTYPFILAFPLQMELMTQQEFPFALLGLVHVRNNITRHRHIGLGEKPDIYCRTGELFAADKGLEFEIITEVRCGDELVWESTSTMLNRCKVPDGIPPTPEKEEITSSAWTTEKWNVPADTGRRYASVSGDSNPIHLYPLTAKLFGFPRQIAHGMWTKARCLAELERIHGSLPEKAEARVQFKTPMLLPATVCFSHASEGSERLFRVADKNDEKPHLAGKLVSR